MTAIHEHGCVRSGRKETKAITIFTIKPNCTLTGTTAVNTSQQEWLTCAIRTNRVNFVFTPEYVFTDDLFKLPFMIAVDLATIQDARLLFTFMFIICFANAFDRSNPFVRQMDAFLNSSVRNIIRLLHSCRCTKMQIQLKCGKFRFALKMCMSNFRVKVAIYQNFIDSKQ